MSIRKHTIKLKREIEVVVRIAEDDNRPVEHLVEDAIDVADQAVFVSTDGVEDQDAKDGGWVVASHVTEEES